MRIRKHAKLSSLLFSLPSPPLPETPPTDICQLNQSPWDVIPFSSFPNQLEGEDFFFSGNASADDPPGATQSSIASKNDDIGTPKQGSGFDFSSNELDLCSCDNDGNGSDSDLSYGAEVEDSPVKGICKKTNGKSWRCTRETREGHYYCDYHSKPRRQTTNSYTAVAGAWKDGPPVTEIKKRRGRPPKKAGTGTQPTATKSNQFYYYSGFGPLWGKRRNERGADGWESHRAEIEAGSSPPSPYSSTLQIDSEEMDDEDEVSGDSGGKKRVRKPVKARSLKSLM